MEAPTDEFGCQIEEMPMLDFISNEISNAVTKYQHAAIKLQNALHKIAILRHFADSGVNVLRGLTYTDLLEMITKAPVRVHLVVSSNCAQFLSDWVKDFVTQPIEFARAVHKAFPVKNSQLLLFSRVTFPAVFHHFITLEYLELGEQFLREYLSIAPSNFGLFFCSFMNSAYSFCDVLCRTYDRIMCRHEKRNQSTVCFSALLRALKAASVGLSGPHIRVMEVFKSSNTSLFALTLVGDFLKPTLTEALNGRKLEEVMLFKVLDFARDSHSKHFEIIYRSMIPTIGSKWVPQQSEFSPNPGRTVILFSAHEASLIEKIVVAYPAITNLKHSKAVSLPDGIYQNFQPIYYEFSMSSFQKDNVDDNHLFGSTPELIVADDPSLKRRWNELETASAIVGVTPFDLLRNGSVRYNYRQNSDDKPLYVYGRALCHNHVIESRKKYDLLMGTLRCQQIVDDFVCYMSSMLTLAIQRYIAQMFAAASGYSIYSGTPPLHSSRLHECLAVQRYYDIFQLNQVPKDVSAMLPVHARNPSQFTPRVKNSDSWDSIRLKRKRRQSFSIEQGEAISCGKSILAQIQAKNIKSPLQADIYLRTLEDWHHDDKLLATLKDMYTKMVKVMKGQRTGVEKCYLDAVPYLARVMKKGDDLVYVRRGPSVSCFTELSEELFQVHTKFFQKESEAKSLTGAKMMEIAVCEAESDGFFEAFMWFEKLFPGSPDLMARVPKHRTAPINFVRNAFLQLLGEMNPDILVKIEEFRQHLTVAGRF